MTYNLGEKMKRHVKPKLHENDEEKDLARRVEISKKKTLFIIVLRTTLDTGIFICNCLLVFK